MNENAIKNYATWARRELMAEVERRCALYGISDDKDCPYDAESVGGRVLSSEERRMRRELVGEAKRGMPALVERAAYTWFNRMLAIRFMECNDRLPSQTRMFSAPDGTFAPQALKEALSVEIENVDRAKVAKLVQDGDDEKLFRYLFLLQCDELADCMPAVFDKVGKDPLVLLLPDGLLRPESVIGKLVIDIAEDDWRDGVQIVGWMYQFYISEKKDEFFASKRKATAEDIPAATQLFTPEWIVRYLVQNSLGRLWMLNRPGSRLAEKMDYFIAPDPDAHEEFQIVSSPEEITLIDPACGSGHILVYAFDLLAAIYEECGYSRRDIPRLILEKNLTGIEIDQRAGALASFVLTMKACEYDSRFMRRGVRPMITILEKIEFGQEHIDVINAVRVAATKNGEPFLLDQVDLLNALAHLNEVGSLFVPTDEDMVALCASAKGLESTQGLFDVVTKELIEMAIRKLEPLHSSYTVVVANPPYMSNGSMNAWLKEWIRKQYPDVKSDVFACFIVRNSLLCKEMGELGFMTPFVWMFILSYEKLRHFLISEKTITSLIQLEYSGFAGATVPICTFTIANRFIDGYEGGYVRLSDFVGAAIQGPKALEAISNPNRSWFYRTNSEGFKYIPGWLIGYWASDSMIEAFRWKKTLADVACPRSGLTTGDNLRFLRCWWECSLDEIGFNCINRSEFLAKKRRWAPCNKGGEYRKWYGNRDYIVNWKNDGAEMKSADLSGTTFRNSSYYFRAGLTWSAISSSDFHMRWSPSGSISERKGAMAFSENYEDMLVALGAMNSSSVMALLRIISPTLDYLEGPISRVPMPNVDNETKAEIVSTVSSCIEHAKTDYDAFENSWDYLHHPLVPSLLRNDAVTLESVFRVWEEECRVRFKHLKKSEEHNNQLFSKLYHLEDEALNTIPDDKVSVRLANKTRDVKSLISYAIGCMLGRYSLDLEGLVLANQGDGPADYLAKVPEPTFMPDDDGIIPITDTEYFHDDATGFFVDFVRTVYGEESLEDNLAFVADALGGSGTPREVIRNYFMNGFFADHCKTYQKRPIYWLFDSGKKGGFRALVYMHRYKPDLLAKLRTDYVHEQQDRYRTQIEHIDDAIEATDRKQQAELKKHRKKLSEQLAEISIFEEKVHHLADQMIEIDLDDGVKVNYAKFQDVLAKIK